MFVCNNQWVSKRRHSPQTRTTLQTHNTVHSTSRTNTWHHVTTNTALIMLRASCADSECSRGRIQLAEAAGIQTRALIRMGPGSQDKQRLQRAVGQRQR